MQIALIEDDAALAENYRDIFERDKWNVVHYDGRAVAVEGLLESIPDLAIIDVGLGAEEEGGFQLCRELRANPKTENLPIIILTARGAVDDRVYGLNLGADDYCTKDLPTDYLIAVIKKLFRRIEMDKSEPRARGKRKKVGSLEILPEESRAFWKGECVDITVGQYWIVERLVELPGAIKKPQQLMINDVEVATNTVASNIKRIRQAFRAIEGNHWNCIQNEFARGYRWIVDSDKP